MQDYTDQTIKGWFCHDLSAVSRGEYDKTIQLNQTNVPSIDKIALCSFLP